MKESEAKQKWCPYSMKAATAQVLTDKSASISVGSYNRTKEGTPPMACRCLGSACMMWAPDISESGEPYGNCGLKKTQ